MVRALTISLVLAAMVSPSFGQDIMYFNKQVIGPATLPPLPAPEEAVGAVQKALNLTDPQVTALRALLNLRTEISKSVLQELAEKQRTLQTLLSQQNPAALDIGNAYLAVQSAQNGLRAAEEKFQTDFRTLLTAAQRGTLQNFQNASNQIDGLRMLGVLPRDLSTFEIPLPGPGIGAFGVSPGAGTAIRILRTKEPPQR